MLHIFERTQQCLQKVVCKRLCSLCKVILQVIFACLFTIIIYREHTAKIINWCLFKMHLSSMLLIFETMPHFLQRVLTLRNGILYAKSFCKGYGLMSLAGHTPKRWPVSSRPCDCQTFRPALHGAWEASFLTHTTVAHATLAYTTLLQATFLHTTCSHACTTISTQPHTQLLHTHNCFTLIHHTFLTRTHTHTQLFHVQLFKTYWSSTTSFAFPSFRVPLQL